MKISKLFLIFFIVFIAFVSLPLGIASIVLGAIHPGSCDIRDPLGLNVSQYLLGLGISSTATSVLVAIFASFILYSRTRNIGLIGMTITSILSALFGIAWYIIGGIILYRSNIDCINRVSVHIIYATVLWGISTFSLVSKCCTSCAARFQLD